MDAVIAGLGWVVLVWLPGVLLSAALRPKAKLLRHAAVGALAGAGLTMLVGQAWTWLDVAVRPATVLPVTLGLPAVAAAVAWRLRPRLAEEAARETATFSGTDARWLAASAVLGIAVWAWAIPSLSAVLPFIDGAHHGLFAYRIETLHTLAAHRVLTGDLAAGSPSYSYYPLALHLCVALIASVTGVAINQVFVVAVVLAAAVLLPLGMFVLMRWLLPTAPAVARLTAVLAAIFPWFPFSPLLWGAVPLIIAMCQVPALVEAFGDVAIAERVAPTGILLGLAAYGMFAEHNTELVTFALYSAILLLLAWRRLDRDLRRRRVGVAVVAAVLVGALVLPSLHSLSGGVTERTGNLGHGHGSGLSPLEWVIGAGNPVILVLAVSGLAIALRRRWLVSWSWCLAVTAVLFASTLASPAILPWMTVAWYSAPSRLSYMFGYFAPAYAALGVWVIFERTRARAMRGAARPRVARLAAAVPLGLLVTVGVLPVGKIFVTSAYHTRSLVGADQRAAFAWLAEHVKPGERVLNQFTDDSTWMQTLDGVTPLFAIDPLSVPARDWGSRWHLLNHAPALGTDAADRAAVAEWHVRYVYVGARIFTHQSRHFSARQLLDSTAYRQVFHQGSASVFEVVGS